MSSLMFTSAPASAVAASWPVNRGGPAARGHTVFLKERLFALEGSDCLIRSLVPVRLGCSRAVAVARHAPPLKERLAFHSPPFAAAPPERAAEYPAAYRNTARSHNDPMGCSTRPSGRRHGRRTRATVQRPGSSLKMNSSCFPVRFILRTARDESASI